MTEQPPSASKEALRAADEHMDEMPLAWRSDDVQIKLARALDRFAERVCEQRVSATVRHFDYAMEALDVIAGGDGDPQMIAQLTVDGIRAPAERPAPEGPRRVMEGMRREGLPDDHPLQSGPSALAASTGEQPASPAAVVDYTERVDRAHEHLIARLSQFNGIQPPEVIKAIHRYRDAVASEHQAEIAAVREQVNYFKAEYQDEDGLTALRYERDEAMQFVRVALLARLQEPDVREAVKAAMRERDFARDGEYLPDDCYEAFADAALTKIAEMLK